MKITRTNKTFGRTSVLLTTSALDPLVNAFGDVQIPHLRTLNPSESYYSVYLTRKDIVKLYKISCKEVKR